MSGPWEAGARRLDVFLNESRVGELATRDDIWAFRYDSGWMDRQRMPLCNSLPLAPHWQIDTPTQRPAFWFFENLLPEEQALQATARTLGLRPEQHFELLAALGAESAGALTLLPPGSAPGAADIRILDDSTFQHRLRDLAGGSLTRDAPKRMSLAGAQHKLAVIYDSTHDCLYEPVGTQASTHILKPQHPHPYYSHSVANEYFCMRLADASGLPVPPVWIHRTGTQSVYLVERFDRRRGPDDVQRLYALDTCQLLGIPRRSKYDASTLENLRLAIDQTTAPAATRQQVLRWIAFNVLIGNGDAHLKNLSFLRDGDELWLAPAYDLVSTAVYAVDDAAESGQADGLARVDMVVPLAGETRLLALRRQHLRDSARALGARPAAMDTVLDRLLAQLPAAADRLLAEIETAAWADAGARRLLRQIRHAVIARMAPSL